MPKLLSLLRHLYPQKQVSSRNMTCLWPRLAEPYLVAHKDLTMTPSKFKHHKHSTIPLRAPPFSSHDFIMDQNPINNFRTLRLETPTFGSSSPSDSRPLSMDSKETPVAMASVSSAAAIEVPPANPNARINNNGPQDQFQITRHLLYERDFGGDAYVSAHLQRLQNGCFTDKNVHEADMLHVTFAAVTFTFHPSLSDTHRFKSAMITITASSSPDGCPIKFLKFAPHLAFGRISSASLKWYFQLAATVGVTKGISEASLKPTLGYEKDMVVGSMVKMYVHWTVIGHQAVANPSEKSGINTKYGAI